MQPFSESGNTSAARCAAEVLEAVPPVLWFIRREMHGRRGRLSVPQFRALAMVHRQPQACLSAVAEHLGTALPTVSRVVGGLVTQGLLVRRGCTQDRRQMALAVTPRGRAILAQAERATRQSLACELAALSDRDCDAITRAMAILRLTFEPRHAPAARG